VIRRTFMLFAALLAVVSVSERVRAEEPATDAKKGARILMVTQSAGFRHGSVTRKDGELAPAERAITELGISSGLFRVDCTQWAFRAVCSASIARRT
jgi:uncharacterized protein